MRLDNQTGCVFEATPVEVGAMTRLELDVPGVALPTTAQHEHQIDGAPGGAQLENLGGMDTRASVAREREQVSGPGPEQQLERLISVHSPGG